MYVVCAVCGHGKRASKKTGKHENQPFHILAETGQLTCGFVGKDGEICTKQFKKYGSYRSHYSREHKNQLSSLAEQNSPRKD